MRKKIMLVFQRSIKTLLIILIFIIVSSFFVEITNVKTTEINKMGTTNVTFYTNMNSTKVPQVRVHRPLVKNGLGKTIYEHPFKYLIKPTGKCISGGAIADPFLLIVIKSNVRNLDYRMAIRFTWGNISESSVKVIFSLGYSPFLQEFIDKESSLYNDIVQQDFLDDYHNNTLKTVMSFNWSVTNCLNTKYFFFVDDDYLVNVKLLIDDIRRKHSSSSILTGCVWQNAKPNRNVRKKWYVSKKEYPHDVWPPYPTGGSVLISYDYASRIKDAFKTIKPLYIDDVYLGIIAKQLKISLTNDCRFHPYYNPEQIQRLYSIHNFQSPRKLVEDWKNLNQKIIMFI